MGRHKFAVATTAAAALALTVVLAVSAAGATGATGWKAQLHHALKSCAGSAPKTAKLYKNKTLASWLRHPSPIPAIRSPYAHFKAKSKPPWVIGFVNSYAGNDWRKAVYVGLSQAQKALSKWDAKKQVQFLSNGSVTTHISQIQQLIRDHVNAIIDIGPSATATNGAIKQAYKAGIPVVTVDAPVTSPYAVNVSTNNWLLAQQSMGGLIRQLKGQGNIILVEGITGEPGSDIWQSSAECIVKKMPGMHVVASVDGQWTESVAKTAVSQVLATHPETINGVWTQGVEAIGVIQAFQQAGRQVPVVTGLGEEGALAYWHDTPGARQFHSTQPPMDSTIEGVRVAIRILQGQGPILNDIYNVGPAITKRTLGKWYKSRYHFPSSTGFAEIPEEKWMPTKTLNKYFHHGHSIRKKGVDYPKGPFG